MQFSVSRAFYVVVTALILAIISACSGGSDGKSESEGSKSTPSQTSISQGVFVDSEVSGLSYVSGSLSGITSLNGTFEYEVGENVTFSIGGVVLGSSLGAAIITPLELVPTAVDETDPQVQNMLSLLQTLDDDDDLSNGIHITDSMRDLVGDAVIDFSQGLTDFSNDSEVIALVDALTSASSAGTRSLVSSALALAHFQQTLADLNDTSSSLYCSDNTPQLNTGEGNIYTFDVPTGNCLGINDDPSPRKSIPLNLLNKELSDDVSVLTDTDDFDVENNARIYLRTGGFNFGGFSLFITFDISNNSNSDFCLEVSDLKFLDDDGLEIEELEIFDETSRTGPERFLNEAQRCYSAGFTHHNIQHSFLVSNENFERISSIEVGELSISPLENDFSGIATKAPSLDASLSWLISNEGLQYPALRATFTNNLGVDIRLDDGNQIIWFFNEGGYVVSNAIVRLHDALGLDNKEDLEDADFVISGAGGTFSLLDEIADNAAVTPSRSTTARIYLNWEYEDTP